MTAQTLFEWVFPASVSALGLLAYLSARFILLPSHSMPKDQLELPLPHHPVAPGE
jgi:hypothetical protein